MTDYTATITVNATPAAAFAAINNVRGWWSETVEGASGAVGDSYVFEVPDVHRCTMTTTESIPGERLVWHVTDSFLSFVDDSAEWDDTDVTFELTQHGDDTEIRFTHAGLGECYDICANAWSGYVTHSLRDLITTGTGDPFLRGTKIETEARKHGNTELLGLA